MIIGQSASSATTYVGAGVLLMRLGFPGDIPRFLLLQGRDTGIWSFSKGHPEPEDAGTPLRTAVRETREETGYELGRDYSLVSDTSVRLGKRPYWVGLMRPGAPTRPRLAPGEHSDCGWFSWSEVGRLPTNTDVRAWFKKALVPNSGFARIMISGGLMIPGLLEEVAVVKSSSRHSTHLTALACSAS